MASTPPTYSTRLTLWQQTWRYLTAVLVGVVTLFAQIAEMPEQNYDMLIVDVALGFVALGLMALRRRYPFVTAMSVSLIGCLSASSVGPAVFVVISMATHRRWSHIIAVAPVYVAAGLVYEAIYLPSEIRLPWWGMTSLGILGYSLSVAIGLYIGARRDLLLSLHERAETAEREQEMRVVQAQASERARIAREMHDVLAHRISLVSMHAGALGFREDLTREETAAAAKVIQENAHQAMVDLRDVLGVLRGADDVNGRPERPQPTLREVADLVEESRSSGMTVSLDSALDDPSAVPESIGRHGYRIIQEGLTNARKHAPGAPVDVKLSGSPGGRLEIVVSNPLRPAGRNGVPRSGVGLLGLTERAAISGGALTHGPTRDARYVVKAWLPWQT